MCAIRSPPDCSRRQSQPGLWSLRYTAAGRLIARCVWSRDAARLAGVNTSLVTMCAFVSLGALTGLAAVLNAMRFNQVPANTRDWASSSK